jgi:subtilisin family serine protease
MMSGCGGVKTTDTVFPTTAGICAQGASQNRFIVEWEDGTFTVENGASPESFRNNFVSKNLHMIRHVDQDQRVQFIRQNDLKSFSEVATQTSAMNWGPHSIEAPTLWNQDIKGDGVVVGVVDGMVDTSHVQLTNNFLVNEDEIPDNNVDDDHNGFVDDYKGVQVNDGVNDPDVNQHGTHVTGTIVADHDAGPVTGVSPRAKVLPAQFIGNDGGGSIGDAIIALNYVADRGAKIINMSWGLDPCVEVPNLKSALQALNSRGILLVTAAGNGDSRGQGVNMDVAPAYPSAYNFTNQINVAAASAYGYLAGFSNFGLRSVHVAGPGVGIWSTVPGDETDEMSGTSMAAPMVSGAAALLWSAIPSATATQVKEALMKSVDVPSTRLDVESGGVINVNNALTKLKAITGK